MFICNFYFLGVDDRVKAEKRKSKDLDCDEVTKKKRKQSNVDKSKNKDVKPEKKSRPHKGNTTLFSKFAFHATYMAHSFVKTIITMRMCHPAKVKFQIVFLHLCVKYYLLSIGVKKYLKFYFDIED